MSLVSNVFILFVIASVAVYYFLPKRFRWWALLVSSYVYYLAAGSKYVVYLLFSSVLTYLCGKGIAGSLEENKKRAKRILVIGLILNFGMLGVVKYTNFILENLNAIFRMELPGMAIC